MSKQHNIRWRESDDRELKRTIKNFNAKVDRLRKKQTEHPDVIPEKITFKEAKDDIKTRADLNRFLNKHKRFSKRGAENVVKSSRGAVATKWEVDEFNIAQRAENIRRTNKRKKLEEKEVTIAGKPTGVKRAEMGKIKENAVKPSKKKFKNMSQKEWEKAVRLFDKKMTSSYSTEQQRNMLRNYMKGMIREGYSDEMLEMMNTIPIEKFIEIVDTDETATFDFIYDPIELRAKQEQLHTLWSQHSAGENINNIDIMNIIEEVENEITL